MHNSCCPVTKSHSSYLSKSREYESSGNVVDHAHPVICMPIIPLASHHDSSIEVSNTIIADITLATDSTGAHDVSENGRLEQIVKRLPAPSDHLTPSKEGFNLRRAVEKSRRAENMME